jgi:hypothetical protein
MRSILHYFSMNSEGVYGFTQMSNDENKGNLSER